MILALLVLVWMLGSERGLLGALAGAFLGTLAAVGMVTATSAAELAGMYSPVGLAAGAVSIGLAGAVLALVVPYLTGVLALAWAVGSGVSAYTAIDTGQAAYVVPFVLHGLVALAVLRLAAPRMVWH